MDLESWRRARCAAAGDAFREHRTVLLPAVTDIHVLANSFYSRRLISREQLEDAQLQISLSERKVHLFDAIEARLRSIPGDIFALINILRSDPLLQIFTERIWRSYAKNCEEPGKKVLEEYLKKKDVDLYSPVVVLESKFDDDNAPPSTPRASYLPCDDKQAELKDKIEEYVEPDPHVSVTKEGFLSESIDDGEKVERSYMVNKEYEHASKKTRGIEESIELDESVKKKGLLSGVRRGIRKMFGAARDMTAGLIKSTLSVLKLDIKIFRKYKKRFDKHTDREQVRWWFEIWGDESALKALESKWEEVSAKNKWRLETCRPVPPQKC